MSEWFDIFYWLFKYFDTIGLSALSTESGLLSLLESIQATICPYKTLAYTSDIPVPVPVPTPDDLTSLKVLNDVSSFYATLNCVI